MSSSTPSTVGSLDIRRLILVPALITLAVTLLRLAGEVMHWSPRLFNREAGGPGSLVGIVWLVPVFAIYFALKVLRAGDRPRLGRAALLALGAIAVWVAAAVVLNKMQPGPMTGIGMFSLASLVAVAIAYAGWPTLGKVLVAYGLSARIPVAIIMLIALYASWGTHYEKGPPGFPAMGVLSTWFWIGFLPQLTLWMAFTVALGILIGAAVGAFRRAEG